MDDGDDEGGRTVGSGNTGITFTRNADGKRCRTVTDDKGSELLKVLIGSGCNSENRTHRSPVGTDASLMIISIGSSAMGTTIGSDGRNAKASCIAIRGNADCTSLG
ncbi:MAG TPA: hypothetical protein VGV86_07785, partial [Acidimicrobiales bacterium]|nr:hypothetical protein [Acidimicrobiales bacterium]